MKPKSKQPFRRKEKTNGNVFCRFTHIIDTHTPYSKNSGSCKEMPSNNINSHTHKEINTQIAVIVEINHILKKIKQNHDPLVSSHPYTIISHLTKMYSLILIHTLTNAQTH